MASPEPAAQLPDLAKESSTSSAPAAAGQEEAPQEPVLEPAAQGDETVKGDGEEEEEAECGFCLFMKGGGCKDAFVAWMDCVDASDKEGGNMVERCAQTTINLKNCMDAHADYYAPVLEAEKAVSAQAEAAAATAAEAEDKGAELPAASTLSSSEEKNEETASSPPAAGEAK